MNPEVEDLEVEIKPCRCPRCKELLEAATSIHGLMIGGQKQHPRVGDVTICLYCATLLMFGDKLALRYPLREEVANLKRDRVQWRKMMIVQAAVRKQIKDRHRQEKYREYVN